MDVKDYSEKMRRVVGNTIREKRMLCAISQEQLAERCGLDRTYIGGIERAERNPSLINLCKISYALNIELKELLK